MRLPKAPTHAALYSKKVTIKAVEKIHKIHEETGASKWQIIDKIICNALGIKTTNTLDLSKWTK